MKKLNTFLENVSKLKFGDYILFQKYNYNNKQFEISKPILAIYLGYFVADQTLGFNYVKWVNPNHTVYITNENVTRYPTCEEVDQNINNHIEWDDYIDILGHWQNRPTWKEIIKDYRNQNLNNFVNCEEIIGTEY